jgi:hypothetical protein
MSRRTQALTVVLVMLVAIAACGVSFGEAAAMAMDRCGPDKGWGPAKAETSGSAKPLPGGPALPVASVDVCRPALHWMGTEGAAPSPWRILQVQPRAPRAPPLD